MCMQKDQKVCHPGATSRENILTKYQMQHNPRKEGCEGENKIRYCGKIKIEMCVCLHADT